MIFARDYLPQFREADAGGKVGIRGYLNYFQDMATSYMKNFGKGNDTLIDDYSICWMYTKYKITLKKQSDFGVPLHFETWVEKEKPSIRLHQCLTISRDAEIYAQGRMESCLVKPKTGTLCRMEAIDFPIENAENKTVEVEPFVRLKKSVDGMDFAYSHTVRYTDLDKTRHMNNLLYVNLLLNAFDSDFYEDNAVSDFEIHYLNQCFEGEEIRVFKAQKEDKIITAGVKEDNTIAVQAVMKTKNPGEVL